MDDVSVVEKKQRAPRAPRVTKTTIAKKPVVKQPLPTYPIIDTDYENPWMYKGNIFNSTNINDAHGFIYCIEELSSGRIYIGQKLFWTKKTRMVNKKKKKIKAESEWKKYYSSSSYIMEKYELEGHSDFRRSIVAIVNSDGMLNYIEMQMQMDLRVLENEAKFINGYIGGRISRSHYNADKLIEVDEEIMKYIRAK